MQTESDFLRLSAAFFPFSSDTYHCCNIDRLALYCGAEGRGGVLSELLDTRDDAWSLSHVVGI